MDPGAIRLAAIALLARRDFATGELREKLRSQGYDTSVVEETVAELSEEGMLNDVRYAEHFVAYHAQRGHGPVRIKSDLKAMGLSGDLLENALASGPDWSVLAREVRIRRFGEEAPETWAEKSRQARFLQYRGFSTDHIRTALGPDFNLDP